MSSTIRKCKICKGDVEAQHTVLDTTYYYCPSCDFLQNYFWEDRPKDANLETTINAQALEEKWPAGEEAYMHEIGWRTLEHMFWPIAWKSRIAHNTLKYVPGYTAIVKRYIKSNASRILDFGCGHGVAVVQLYKKDNFDIVGVDPFSSNMSERIYKKELREMHFPDNSFDGIYATEVVEHMTDVLGAFAELYRILKPGGVLLAQTHRLEDPGYARDKDTWYYLEDPSTHVAIYSEKSMREIAKRIGFSEVKFRGIRLALFVK